MWNLRGFQMEFIWVLTECLFRKSDIFMVQDVRLTRASGKRKLEEFGVATSPAEENSGLKALETGKQQMWAKTSEVLSRFFQCSCNRLVKGSQRMEIFSYETNDILSISLIEILLLRLVAIFLAIFQSYRKHTHTQYTKSFLFSNGKITIG